MLFAMACIVQDDAWTFSASEESVRTRSDNEEMAKAAAPTGQ
jgi:hypothetical protein